ncbi:MAG TPA: TonB-dependent receptor [Thermoanaerobaculia bacterium]|nr:TonB-dependent receptor [Thermoanaerobaculia bacterium]
MTSTPAASTSTPTRTTCASPTRRPPSAAPSSATGFGSLPRLRLWIRSVHPRRPPAPATSKARTSWASSPGRPTSRGAWSAGGWRRTRPSTTPTPTSSSRPRRRGPRSSRRRSRAPRSLARPPATSPCRSRRRWCATSAFIQDTWRFNPKVTFKLGVRYDQVQFDNDIGAEIADMDAIQPRLALAWDITGDSKTVARFNWGRFMHPNALTLPNFACQDTVPTFRYLSCSFNGLSREACEGLFGGLTLSAGGFTVPRYILDPQSFDPAGWVLVPSQVFSSEPSQIAPGLEPTVAEELILGIERELTRRTAISLSYVDKETDDILEDTCNGNLPTPSANAACDFYVMANIPGLRREYQGFLLGFESRATDWLHVLASYVYSESKGNVEYNQNAGSDFDIFPDHFDNRFGFLSDHQRHRGKLNGYVDLPLDFTVGWSSYWSSGMHFEAREAGPIYGEVFLEPRGSRESDELYRLDLQASKGFDLGRARLQVIAAVLNVLDDEQVLAICDRVEGCGSESLGAGRDFRQPRSFEAGFRVQF